MFVLKGFEILEGTKSVDYFGKVVYVPENTKALAVDSDGHLYAYTEIPTLGEEIWDNGISYCECGGYVKFEGDWEDSLMILED